MLANLFRHVSIYSLGNVLIALAGFISFPILTRLFTVAEYGILNLISATLGVIVAFSKAGIQKSIIRFYGEIESKADSSRNLMKLYSTSVLGMVFISIGVAALWVPVSQLIPLEWIGNDYIIYELFLITSVLIIVRVTGSAFSNIFIARQQSTINTVLLVSQRYLVLSLVLLTLFFVSTDLSKYYYAVLSGEALLLIFTVIFFYRSNMQVRLNAFDFSFLKKLVQYGLPLVGFEVASYILSIGDRYIIQYYLGAEQMGLYSASYNLCEYINSVLILAVGTAVMPIYIKLWESQGEQKTREFISSTLRIYILLGLPVIFGLAAVGDEFISTLASQKYREASYILPYIIAGMLFNGSLILIGAGLHIQKKTMTIMWLIIVCALINVALNIVLVPELGIYGAALTTLLSYIILSVLIYIFSRKTLSLNFPYWLFTKYTFVSIGMYYFIGLVNMDNTILQLAVKIISGAVFYVFIVCLIDKNARNYLTQKIIRLK